LKRKINSIKGPKKFKRMRTKLKNIIDDKLGLNDEIDNKQNFYKKAKKKKTRNEVEVPIKRVKL
jgi:hypothetical protein